LQALRERISQWYAQRWGLAIDPGRIVVTAAIDAVRSAMGITPRKIGAQEIVQRLVFALVNEAAHILEEGIAMRAGDIDIVYLYGYGFPAFRGGPMRYADELGLFSVVQSMQRFAANPHADASFWKPAPLLSRLAAAGKTFT
jgi:3-hydroxyacyl-CoA dehydrogenase